MATALGAKRLNPLDVYMECDLAAWSYPVAIRDSDLRLPGIMVETWYDGQKYADSHQDGDACHHLHVNGVDRGTSLLSERVEEERADDSGGGLQRRPRPKL